MNNEPKIPVKTWGFLITNQFDIKIKVKLYVNPIEIVVEGYYKKTNFSQPLIVKNYTDLNSFDFGYVIYDFVNEINSQIPILQNVNALFTSLPHELIMEVDEDDENDKKVNLND